MQVLILLLVSDPPDVSTRPAGGASWPTKSRRTPARTTARRTRATALAARPTATTRPTPAASPAGRRRSSRPQPPSSSSISFISTSSWRRLVWRRSRRQARWGSACSRARRTSCAAWHQRTCTTWRRPPSRRSALCRLRCGRQHCQTVHVPVPFAGSLSLICESGSWRDISCRCQALI